MRPRREHSPASPRASNAAGDVAWTRLGPVCRALARVVDPAALDALLDLALDASGAERAFLVLAERSGDRQIAARRCRRADGRAEPSASLLRRALAGSRRVSSVDLDREPAGSVRSLSLRCFVAQPVPASPGQRGVLLLDSRRPSCRPGANDLLEVISAVAGLALRCVGSTPRVTQQRSRDPLRGSSPAFARMSRWVRRVAATDLPVLVAGESGAGKESVCRALHDLSRRSAGPFVAVNSAAFADSLLDAELFGAARGAYTGSDADRPGLFRAASGGTLVLDEVGDMPATMQAKLLRVLEEQRVRPVGGSGETAVDVRVVAATHLDLGQEVASGRFRDDLYHRLAMLEVFVPPLRERLEDLPEIVRHLAPRLLTEVGAQDLQVTAAAWDALRGYRWPGNVRELRAVLARALLHADGGPIGPEALGLLGAGRSAASGDGDSEMASLERQMIERTLEATGGSIAAAAARIGWSRQKLYRRMRRLGLSRGAAMSELSTIEPSFRVSR